MENSELIPGIPYAYVREGSKGLDAMSGLLVELEYAGYERVITTTLSRMTSSEEFNMQLQKQMLEGFDGVVVVSLLGIESEDYALEICCKARDSAAGAEVRIVFVLAAKDDIRLARAAHLAGLRQIG